MRECQNCKKCYPDSVAHCPDDGTPTVHTIAGEPVLEGKYHIEYRLGQGGMGVVYKARHAYLKTQLAIKVILPDLVGNDPQLVTRFRQEALAAAAIRHQNVVSVTDYGVIDGSVPFLVMEYVEGEALHDLLAREGALSPEYALELMTAICAGVGAAHQQGIVHRDLKPLNIMICSDKAAPSQAVKILDFGLAKIKSGELLGSFVQAQTTGLMGSPYYMAPEQWADDEPDSRADIYSLGVMLFQMLAGDVPFKGSSIPAIMKKHISDAPPTFAEVGVKIDRAIEDAILHTLQKHPADRTPTVEAFVAELNAAIQHSYLNKTSPGQTLPTSSLKILSKPPRSSVYMDNVSMGETHDSGILLLEGVQSGNHHLMIRKDGYKEWRGDVICDGSPKEIYAELKEGSFDQGATIAMPNITVGGSRDTIINRSADPGDLETADETVLRDRSVRPVAVDTGGSGRGSRFSPLLLGIGGLFGLLLIVALGSGAAYMLGLFGPLTDPAGDVATPSPQPTQVVTFGPDLAPIPGGKFIMGNNEGRENERPEHEVALTPFLMDKTEVTNGEYYQFVKESGYRPVPAHWVNDQPVATQLKMPVRFVNIDDITAFASWRSKRDGITYRLPTEAEWEYAARNGSKNNKYPWGDEFETRCAVTDKENTEPEAVGTASCPNDWDVLDLIGNVYEWTGSKASVYPGSKGMIRETREPRYMIRGGAAFNKSIGEFAITATFRADVEASRRDKELGFRLVVAQ